MYTDDYVFEGMTFARTLRSRFPHARVLNINTDKAKSLPGVHAVLTAADIPGENIHGLVRFDWPVLCAVGDKVRYMGDAVAIVAADSEVLAEQAMHLIEVEYEPLDPVFDPEVGARPDAPLVHPDLGNYEVASFILPEPGTNISNHFKIRKGNVTAAWPDCAAIVERKYHIPHVQHVPIEPHVVAAKVDEAGKVGLWSSSQSPFAQRNLIATALGISHSDLRVIAPYVGGGFGGKAGVSMEALAVAIATKVPGRTVKLRLTREEEFYTAFVRQGLVAHFKMGCDARGRLLAMENTFYWDGGAYTEYGVNVTRAAGYRRRTVWCGMPSGFAPPTRRSKSDWRAHAGPSCGPATRIASMPRDACRDSIAPSASRLSRRPVHDERA
jgi:CO/xanthine dehydrogenase Mo-binding subunit